MNEEKSTRSDAEHTPGFAVLPDEMGGYEAPDDPNRGPLVLALALGVMLVFGVVVWNAYKQGVRYSDDGVLPQIASEGAFKVRPDDPGGRADVNVDKQVLNQLDGRFDGEEEIAPATVREDPVPFDVETVPASADFDGLASKQPAPSNPFEDAIAHSNAMQDRDGAGRQQMGEPGKPVQLRRSEPAQQDGSGQRVKDAPPAAPATQAPATSTEIALNPIEKPVSRAPSASAERIFRPAFASDGAFVVQLAAVKSQEDALGVWGKANDKASNLFSGADMLVQTVDLGAKGVWHRVRAGSFDSRADARAFCQEYKALGGDCIVMSR